METRPNQPQAPGTARYSTLSSALLRYKPKAGPAPPALQIRHSPDTKTHFPATTGVEFVEFSGPVPMPATTRTRTTRIIQTTLATKKLRFRYDRVRVCCRRGTPPLTAHPTPTDHFRFFTEISYEKTRNSYDRYEVAAIALTCSSLTPKHDSPIDLKWAEMGGNGTDSPVFLPLLPFPAGLPSTRTARECSTMPPNTATHPSQQKEAQLASLQRHPQSHNRGVRRHPSLRRGTRPRRPRG